MLFIFLNQKKKTNQTFILFTYGEMEKEIKKLNEKVKKLEKENERLKEKLLFYKGRWKQNKFGGWYFEVKKPKDTQN